MEKTITISGREVPFKSSGAFPVRYKAFFGKDVFAGMAKFAEIEESLLAGDISDVDTDFFYNVAWTMAKTADPTIPPVIEWLDTFEEFPVFSVFADLKDLLYSTMRPTKN